MPISATKSKAVDLYLRHTPKHQRELMSIVRRIIQSTIPDAEETIKFGVPFYSRKRLLCYLSPLKKQEGIYIGFVKGHRMSDESGLFTGKDLKQIRHLEFRKRTEIKTRMLKEYLHEAVMLNEFSKHPFPI